MATRGKHYMNYNSQPQRLTLEALDKSEVIVRTVSKDIERGLTRPSAKYLFGHKSNSLSTLINQDPVLNENVARLGQSLRETEDQLIRDMLETTASAINCTGGTNGRFVAVIKSDLIDLELQAA